MFRKRAWTSLCAVSILIFSLSGYVLAQEFTFYRSPDQTFQCVIPSGWNVLESPGYSREVSGVDGFDAYRGGFEDRVTISIRYYPKDNKLHKDMETYIRTFSQPVLGIREGQSYGAVKDLDLKGTKAKAFERSGYDYESHVYNPKLDRYVEPLHPRKVEYTERFIVMPAMPGKSGFVAFRYKARPDMVKQFDDVFKRVTESFSFSTEK